MSPVWNRRTFLSNLALSVPLSRELFAAPRPASSSYLAFVGFASIDQPQLHRVEVFRVEGARWSSLQKSIPAVNPQALAVHPHLPVLYAAHSTDSHMHLPRGSVSALAFDAHSGVLSRLGEEPLALSATHPSHMTVSPDGRSLLVAASTGGAWNFFALAEDGAILRTPSALKLTGSGPHPLQSSARPHSIVCHPAAPVAYAADFGSDRIDQVSSVSEAPTPRQRIVTPTIARRISFEPGSGPSHLVLHPSGSLIAIVQQLRPALAVLGIQSNGDISDEPLHFLPLKAELAGPLVRNHSGNRLYLAMQTPGGNRAVAVYAWSSSTGDLRRIQQVDLGTEPLSTHLIATENELIMLGPAGLDTIALRPEDGSCIGTPRRVMKSGHAASIVIHSV
ncbi:6-phosphogluconolactonase (cycloisomerase 2 family) [Silvibacterium bohemicum]|uniref:6-phosphogluconolactonase (Cycloisomerase 2 family) n=1 Tax=Silvibacterium bohemicum TaxID=1577686 RepID=A0A841JMY4_9BACT|nr:beta-propeller fold lactonase family protein [Silvibacterium bohemicum]MBB6142603.1 6-phosphogluconolactonase (cycloisomerase 2 family) [Silvibacterium bohemicum]